MWIDYLIPRLPLVGLLSRPERLVGGFEAIEHVAIAVGQLRSDQQHVGLLYRRNTSVRMLHLAFHFDLRDQEPDSRLLWIRPSLHRSRARSLAAQCRLIAHTYADGQVPYGFRYANSYFERGTGNLILDKEASGLTCATFVLAVFASSGVRLISTEDWPLRPEDSEWQRKILSLMREGGAEAQTIMAAESQIGSARFRPDEVAAASALRFLPAGFRRVSAAARIVAAEVQIRFAELLATRP